MSSETSSGGESFGLFTRRVSLVAVTNGVLSLRGILLIPIISKELGADKFGIWVQVIVFVTLASTFSGLGLQNAVKRFLSGMESRTSIRNGYYPIVIASLGISLLVMLLARVAFWLLVDFSDPAMATLVNWSLWLIPIAAIDMLGLTFFIARRRIRIYSLFAIARSYGQVFMVYFFIRQGYDLVGTIQATLLVDLLSGIAMMLLIFRILGLKPPTFESLEGYIRYSLPTVPSMLATWIVTSSDRYIVRLFMNDASVGSYGAAYGVGDSVYFFLSPVSLVLNPTIFSLWEKGEKERARQFMTRALKMFLLFAVPASIGVTYLSHVILLLLSTPEMAQEGWLSVPFIAASMVVLGIGGVLGQVFPLNKDTKRVALIWTLAAGTNVVTNLVLVPVFGVKGAALATLLSYLEALGLILALGKKYSGDFPVFPWGFLWRSILSCLAMLGVIRILQWQISLSLLPEVGLFILTGAAAYFLSLRLVGGLREEELDFVINLLKGKR